MALPCIDEGLFTSESLGIVLALHCAQHVMLRVMNRVLSSVLCLCQLVHVLLYMHTHIYMYICVCILYPYILYIYVYTQHMCIPLFYNSATVPCWLNYTTSVVSITWPTYPATRDYWDCELKTGKVICASASLIPRFLFSTFAVSAHFRHWMMG